MASRQLRTELTIEDKLDIIKALNSNKCSKKDLEEHYKVSKHTINRILLREDELKNNKNSKVRRIRTGNHRHVDEAVSKWYRSMKEKNIYVNGPLLRQQAVRIARMMNDHTFEANNGWLWRWQQREKVKFNLSLKRRNLATEGGNSARTKSPKNKNKSSENSSLPSFVNSNENISWQSMPNENQLEESVTPHFEIKVKEEVEAYDDQRNPFEADVVFDVESDEQGGYDNENNYPPEYMNRHGEEMHNGQGDTSMDHESFQDNNFDHQPDEIKEEFNDYVTNDTQEEPARYRLQNEVARFPEKDIYSIYGEYIARRLRASANERDNHEIYIAQHNIDDVIFKLSMGSYARVPPTTYESSRSRNVSQQARQIDQSTQKQPYMSIIKEKQTFSPTATIPKCKTNGFQNDRSAYNVIDKSTPASVNEF